MLVKMVEYRQNIFGAILQLTETKRKFPPLFWDIFIFGVIIFLGVVLNSEKHKKMKTTSKRKWASNMKTTSQS